MGISFHENGLPGHHGPAIQQVQSGKISGGFGTGDFQDGGRNVDDGREGLRIPQRWHLAGPADQHGSPDSQLERREFRPVAVLAIASVPAIVREIKNYGIIG